MASDTPGASPGTKASVMLPSTSPAAPTLVPAGTVEDGRDLHTADGGRALLLTRRAGAERRTAALTPGTAFATLPFPTCLTRSAVDAARTRLLVLSECPNDVQRLALYRLDGTVVWTAALGTAVPPLSTPDAPPVNIAVVGDVAVVSRPALGGGTRSAVLGMGAGTGGLFAWGAAWAGGWAAAGGDGLPAESAGGAAG